jgi:large subunit ribosomal protein L29
MDEIIEIRDQSDEQLEYRLSEIDKELFNLINELKTTHKLEKPHLLKELKKQKAKILTVLNERKIGKKCSQRK